MRRGHAVPVVVDSNVIGGGNPSLELSSADASARAPVADAGGISATRLNTPNVIGRSASVINRIEVM